MKPLRTKDAGLSLTEVMVATGLLSVVGAIVFTVSNIGFTLYAQNVSINQTITSCLFSLEKLLVKVAASSEAPALVDDAGAAQAGTGPAAGISFDAPLSRQPYDVPSDVSATATSFTITKTSTQPAPRIGDKITMYDYGFAGVITSCSGSGTSFTVGFGSPVGNGFASPKTSGTAIPAGSRCTILAPVSFISVAGELRYYPRSLSVAQHGAAAFGNPANYDRVAHLLPESGQSNCFPFGQLDAARRTIDVNLRLRAPAHGNRIGAFYTFQNMKTTVAYRTAPRH